MNKNSNKNEKLDLNKVSGGTHLVYINNIVEDKDGRYILANYNNNLQDYVTKVQDAGDDGFQYVAGDSLHIYSYDNMHAYK